MRWSAWNPASGSATGFVVATSDSRLTTRRLILAVGGRSYPGCGTSGDGYSIARTLGHTIIETRPALVPIRVEPEWVRSLRGLSLADAIASVETATGQTLEHRREAILFAHFGLTGPAILDVSRAVARHDGPERLTLRLDLLASMSRKSWITSFSPHRVRARRPWRRSWQQICRTGLLNAWSRRQASPAAGWAPTCPAPSGSG